MRSILASTVLLVLCACGGGSGAGDPSGPPASAGFTTFQPATVALGQEDLIQAAPNRGGGVAADTLALPGAPAFAGAVLFVPDRANHRVLGFSSFPSTGAAADLVLGQAAPTSANPGVGPAAMDSPFALAGTASRLFVADTGNHRVLVYDGVPASGGSAATIALGQQDLVSRASPAASASSLASPVGVCAAGARLLVCDTGHHRVLVWDGVPATNGAPADLVLGQADFTGGAANRGSPVPAADSLSSPFGVWSDGTRVAVADLGNHRVLVWNTFPTSSGQPADLVLGQGSFATAVAAQGSEGMFAPSDVTGDAGRLVVGDCENNRILVFAPFPTSSGAAASVVLGQGSFGLRAKNDDDQDGLPDVWASARTLNTGGGYSFVHLAGARLYVGDHRNHRVLIHDGG